MAMMIMINIITKEIEPVANVKLQRFSCCISSLSREGIVWKISERTEGK